MQQAVSTCSAASSTVPAMGSLQRNDEDPDNVHTHTHTHTPPREYLGEREGRTVYLIKAPKLTTY